MISTSLDEVLGGVDHRPFPTPAGRWRFYQEWRDFVFLHYRVDPGLLEDAVPSGLALDLLDGAAWVSVVVFDMRSVRVRGLPAVPGVSDFREANVRTYVRRGDYPGVYFLDILASHRMACLLARLVSRLPYRHARIERSGNTIRVAGGSPRPDGSDGASGPASDPTDDADLLALDYTPDAPITDPTRADLWLTERYALHQDDGRRIRSFNVHHPPWRLRRLEIRSVVGAPILGRIDPVDYDAAHYSEGVPVVAWPGTVEAPTW